MINLHVTRIEKCAHSELQLKQGKIRITAPESLIQFGLLPIIMEFNELHPAVEIELICSSSALDLTSADVDIAFRMTNNPAQDLIGYNLGKLTTATYATKELVEHIHNPKNVLRCIAWKNKHNEEWIQRDIINAPDPHVTQTKKVQIIRTNSMSVMIEMVRSGYGFARLFSLVADHYSELIQLPNSQVLSSKSLWILTHNEIRSSARIKSFREFAIERLKSRFHNLDDNS